MMTENKRIIAEQKELIHKLAWNKAYGCHTRPGFEHIIWPEIAHKARWFIYFDIDGMHALNDFYGSYDPVDAMIKQALSILRSTDYVAGQWKSGDEFLVCLMETEERPVVDPEGLLKRLVESFAAQGLGITATIVKVLSKDLKENVDPAVDKVYEMKKAKGVTR